MTALSEIWEAFIGHIEKMIAERREQIAQFDAGMRIIRPQAGQKIDITREWIAQLEREIASLQNTIDRVRSEHA